MTERISTKIERLSSVPDVLVNNNGYEIQDPTPQDIELMQERIWDQMGGSEADKSFSTLYSKPKSNQDTTSTS